jgi:regulatory protein
LKITKISAQQKNHDRVNVFIDGKYELSLTLNEIIDHKVKVGLELDKASLKALHKISTDGKLKARTLEWLLSRPRSRLELQTYLFKKGLDKDQITAFCDYFAAKNYQNDETFAKWWVGQRIAKNKSDLSIKTELKQKGINSELIANSLQLEQNNKQRLKNLIISKKLTTKYPDKQKLIQYLAGKGFGYSDIVDVLADLNEGAESF